MSKMSRKMSRKLVENKRMSRRTSLRFGLAAILGLGGCATHHQNQIKISGYNPIPPVRQADFSTPILSHQDAQQVLGQYAGVPQINGRLYFPNEELMINITGPLNKPAYHLLKIQDAFAQVLGDSCSCNVNKTFYELGPADTCTEASRSYQLSNHTGLLRVDSLSNCPSYTFTQLHQRVYLGRHGKIMSDIEGQITFGEPGFEARMKTFDPVNGLLVPVEAGGIGFAVTGIPLGAGIGAGYQLLHHGLDTIRGRFPPKQAYHVDEERIITGLPFDSAQTKAALEKLKEFNGDTLAFVPWTRQIGVDNCGCLQYAIGLGVVYGKGLIITGFTDIDRDGCIDTVCFENKRVVGNHLCDLIEMAGWGLLRFGVDEKIIRKYVHSGGGRAGESGGNRHGLEGSGGGSGRSFGGNRHGLEGSGGGSGGSFGGDHGNLSSGRSSGSIGGDFEL